MFELPSRTDVKGCRITAECIFRKAQPLLVLSEEKKAS
jgi:ATP-dependent protease Clp ATPase subunit